MDHHRPVRPGGASSASASVNSWGYHNTFSTHAPIIPDANPPNYYQATTSRSSSSSSSPSQSQNGVRERLPTYSCNVHWEGFLEMRTELSSPFLVSLDNDWHCVYVVLHGTQLSIHRLKKSLFRSRMPKQGRLLRNYSLQHAEIGVAVDWKKGDLIPRATFARVLPKHAQQKLYETDPELFEPIREYVFRMRIEQEQVLFCAPSHAEMLDWVEEICVGIDIAPPLDDRHEPRYRSLPRRTRRQRQIEAAAQSSNDETSREEMERQFIAQQEQLFRSFYPNLAATSSNDQVRSSNNVTTTGTAGSERQDAEPESENNQEPQDNNEFDREDVLGEPTSTPTSPRRQPSSLSLRQTSSEEDEIPAYDPKTAEIRAPMSYNALCRFRRRCAPILLATSPRASQIIFVSGTRYQVDFRRCKLVPFAMKPPRYETHAFSPSSSTTESVESLALGGNLNRPCLARGTTQSSHWSNTSTDIEAEAEPEAEAEEITSASGNEASSMHTIQSVSHEELVRTDTIASTAESVLYPGKGKARALALLKKVSARPMKTVQHSRSYTDEVDSVLAFGVHAPVLV